MKKIRVIHTYQFYYESKTDGVVIVGEIKCKLPNRTKLFKENEKRLSNDDIMLVGWRTINTLH